MPASLKSRGIRHWMGNTRKRGFLLWTGIVAGQSLQTILWIFYFFFFNCSRKCTSWRDWRQLCHDLFELSSSFILRCFLPEQAQVVLSGKWRLQPSALLLVKQLQNLVWRGRKIWTLCSCKQGSSSVQVRLCSWGKHWRCWLHCREGFSCSWVGCCDCSISRGTLDLNVSPVKTICHKILILERVFSLSVYWQSNAVTDLPRPNWAPSK